MIFRSETTNRSRVVLFIGLFSLFLSLPVQAQEGDLRLTTSPLPINLITEPGKTIQTPLRIQNQGTRGETLKIDLMKFKAYGQEGAPLLLDREEGDTFLDWVRFSEDTFTVAPNEWKTITATFTVPENAAFGYYYALVFSRSDENVEVKAGQTALTGGTAILVLLEAKVPNAKREVTVTNFEVSRKWYEFLPATFTVNLKNTGSVHIAPTGNLFIGREGEKEITSIKINQEKGNVLPDSGRTFTMNWDDGFLRYIDKTEDGKVVHDTDGNIEKVLDWNWKDASKLRFGKYQAKLLLVYDDGKRDIPLEGVVDFWVVPWRLVLFSIAVPVVPTLLMYFVMKYRMRRMMRKG